MNFNLIKNKRAEDYYLEEDLAIEDIPGEIVYEISQGVTPGELIIP